MITNRDIISITEKYGSPLYLYDGDLILEKYRELYSFFPWRKMKIMYAMKANYNPAILTLLEQNNAYIDAVSPAEVMLAKKVGFSSERLLYTANNMTDDEMYEVKKEGVLFNIGSNSRLEKYGRAFPGSEICLRFNTDIVAGANEKIQTAGALTKFGLIMSDINVIKKILKRYNLKVVGLHVHTGSGIKNTQKFIESAETLLSMGKREDFPELEFIDFGGGFYVNYNPDNITKIDYYDFGRKLSDIFSDFCKNYGKELEMRFEPGKYIVAEAGHLITQVNTLKNNRNRLIAGTDSGFPQLIRPTMYDAYHHILNISNPDGEPHHYDIAGNICETGDCFAVQRKIPEIRENDILSIETAGAYCYSMGGIYNLRPMPPEVIVVNGKDKLTNKRISSSELAENIYNRLEN
ncbi:MAG: diaminopimelate decarboxylase [Victivallales bacterium]|nr:diaminopimelate decarboxylase [Victivallales bacterium]MCF7889148.1 diaminopimelate decarboxylase [Victivallales bacterium]